MTEKFRFILIMLLLASIQACSDNPKNEEKGSEEQIGDTAVAEGNVPMFKSMEVPIMPDAMLDMYSPLGNENFKSGKVPFEFNIKNHPFGQNRPFMMSINGGEPIACAQAVFQREFNTGAYRIVAYLLDENGLALKEYGNFVDRDFTVGSSGPFPDAEEPGFILNLPVNGQLYQEGDSIIVDYLLLNGDFRSDGLKIQVEIAGASFESKDLNPIQVKQLKKGEYEAKVSLVKDNGEELPGIFSSYKRKIAVQ
ncbi:hypothetical protein [Negadavirga shengliensis]|uniref:Lipoprotein n=1 Tax=Negadavirga shengliensis TaxID=1389218 RepID=A0ABV9SYJ7_9BACT